MNSSLKLFSVRGIDIRVHLTFPLILIWAAFQFGVLGGGGLAGALFGVISISLLFVLVTLHELGHSFAALNYGVPVERITLLPIGGVAQLRHMPDNPKQEFVIALAGPAVNVALAILMGGTAVLFAVGLLGMWELAMVTLSQVIVAVFFSLLIAIPLGIWAARNDVVTAVLRPVLDFLQTIPAFVYLVPVVMLFNVGRVPGIMASVLYALPPAIRLTNLGIRQANPEAVEAAQAFGSTRRQLLFKVQLPLALPSIMAGINQTVMMVLAMVVVAGMVGGAGLGLEAVNGLARNQLGQGIEAGLAIVILAVVIDRLLLAGAARTSVNGNQ